MAVLVAQQIRDLQFLKAIINRWLRFSAVVTDFENRLAKPLNASLRCPAAVEPWWSAWSAADWKRTSESHACPTVAKMAWIRDTSRIFTDGLHFANILSCLKGVQSCNRLARHHKGSKIRTRPTVSQVWTYLVIQTIKTMSN